MGNQSSQGQEKRKNAKMGERERYVDKRYFQTETEINIQTKIQLKQKEAEKNTERK